jgi:hypothetical protein
MTWLFVITILISILFWVSGSQGWVYTAWVFRLWQHDKNTTELWGSASSCPEAQYITQLLHIFYPPLSSHISPTQPGDYIKIDKRTRWFKNIFELFELKVLMDVETAFSQKC